MIAPRDRGHNSAHRGLLMAMTAILLAACGQDVTFHGPTSLASTVVPPHITGLDIVAQPTLVAKALKEAGSDVLVSQGNLYLVRNGQYVAGSIEIYAVKPDVQVEDPAILGGLDNGIAGQRFKRTRLVVDQVMYEKDGTGTQTYLWFPPQSNAVEIVTLRRDFQVIQPLVRALVDSEHGRPVAPFDVPPPPTPPPPPPVLDTPAPGTTVLPVQPTP